MYYFAIIIAKLMRKFYAGTFSVCLCVSHFIKAVPSYNQVSLNKSYDVNQASVVNQGTTVLLYKTVYTEVIQTNRCAIQSAFECIKFIQGNWNKYADF